MRSTMSLCMLAATLLAVMALCTGASAGSYQSRNKPRTIRGFKNVALSTARGFGKRDGAGAGAGAGAGVLDYLANADQMQDRYIESFPVDWFVEELRTNPELARIVVHKFIDTNQDGELSPEELLRPLY